MTCYIISHAQVIYTKQDSINSNFFSICEEIGTTNLLITNTKPFVKQNLDFYFATQLLKITNNGLLIDSIQIDTNFYTFGRPLLINNHYYNFQIIIKSETIFYLSDVYSLIPYFSNFSSLYQSARLYLFLI